MLKKMEAKPNQGPLLDFPDQTNNKWMVLVLGAWQNCVGLIQNRQSKEILICLKFISIELQEWFQYRLCTKTELIRQCQFLRFSIITNEEYTILIQIIFYGHLEMN